MEKFYKEYLKYIFFFVGLLFFNLIISPINLDEVWSYGFTYNIVRGLVPYREFNMVITPFHPFFMSLFMHVFGNNLLVFHIENALMGTFLFYLLFSFINKKAWVVIPFFMFPLNVTYPNYNFFLFFLFFLFIYGEEKHWSDIWMGILIGILFLTKQSVGGVFLLSILIYHSNKRKMLYRFLGFLIPNSIFFLYLLITKSLSSFIDLCFLGLLDFGSGNGNLMNVFFFFTMILFLAMLVLFKRNPHHYYYYYGLLFTSICVPLFDLYHFQLYALAFLCIFLYYHNFSSFRFQMTGILLLIGFFFTYLLHTSFSGIYPNTFSHFEYRYIGKKEQENTNIVIKDYEKYHHKVMFIGPNAYYYKIICNEDITFLDLINTGNHGYHGSDKLLNRVKQLDSDMVFFVSKDDIGPEKQTDQNLIQYVLEHGNKIEENKLYWVYKLGDENETVD